MSQSAQPSDADGLPSELSEGGALLGGLLSGFISQAPQAIIIGIADPKLGTRIIHCNPAFAQITGYTVEEAKKGAIEALLAPKGLHQEWAEIGEALSAQKRCDRVITARRRDGSIFWSNLHGYPVSEQNGNSYWVICLSDITAAQEPLLELKQSEERYRLLADNSRDMITVHRFDGLCIYASPAIRNILGFEPGEFVHKPIIDFFHPDDCALARRILERHFHNRPENIFVHRLRRKDGSFVWCETTSKTTWNLKEPQPGGIIAITRDISKRRLAEQELKAMHMLLSSVFESVPIGLCVADIDGIVRQCNKAFAKILSSTPSDVCGRPLSELLACESLEEGLGNSEMHRANGEPFSATYSITDLALSSDWNKLVTLTDQTEQLAMDAKIQEAQRLESLGTLAGGIAHDFNNLLAIILGYASLLRQVAPDNLRVAEYGDTIMDAGRRGADVVRQLMLYANQHEPLLVRDDLHSALGDVLVKVSTGWPESVNLECAFNARNSTIPHDPEQIARAIEHLLNNARESIPSHGTVKLITADREQRGLEGKVSRWLEIRVEDTGRGMDEATRQRMFEPFFARNKGPEVRGLGLALVYGIIKAHQGRIDVKSTPGVGTSVSILLPHPAESSQTKPPHHLSHQEYSLRLGAVVLLVEDEVDIAKLWTNLLDRNGWQMHWAKNGEEALELFNANKDKIDVLFCDIGLPGSLNGWEVATLIHAAKPEMPIMLASGFFKRGGDMPAGLGDNLELVDKPYQPAEVMERLRALTGRH